jgi:cytochrome c553
VNGPAGAPVLAAAALWFSCLSPAPALADPAAFQQHIGPRANYLERCGGCHGVDGASFARNVPDLKGKAGYFLCNGAGRDYVARLPNVVFAEISDADMAAMLNYVIFDLGAASAPRGARAFTPRELGRARRNALAIPDLEAYRARVVDQMIATCGAPKSLRTEYGSGAGK